MDTNNKEDLSVEKTAAINKDYEIIEQMQKQGHVPKALKLMAKRQGTIDTFLSYRNQIFNEGPLSNKEKSLIALATTVAIKSTNCIAVQSQKAIEAGATEHEIIQVMLIVGLVSGNSPLNTAYSSYYEKQK